MRRVVSVFLPTWPTDRYRRSATTPPPEGAPLVTALQDAGRMVIGGACANARALGLLPGMPLAQAQARMSRLHVVDATQDADAAALRRLAAWAQVFSPLTSADPPDGLWLDVTGCTHLHGGESRLLDVLCGRLARAGISARLALAETPGAAHALARHGKQPRIVVPPAADAGLARLTISALRLPEEIVTALHRVGLERVGQLAGMPRAPLVRRFGAIVTLRLDQASGAVFEPISPVLPPVAVAHRLAFLEPLLTADSLAAAIAELTRVVCGVLERQGQGARRLDLLFHRVDGSWQAIRIGTARPARAPDHLAGLLVAQLDQVDPGLGVEAMHLIVAQAEKSPPLQTSVGTDEAPGVAELVDRMAARLGTHAVYRAAVVESRVPERSVRRLAPLSPASGASWPAKLPRPVRLFDPPQPVSVVAMLPDYPPVRFIWRSRTHVVRRADGPERIFGEWWRRNAEMSAVRDYFAVEDETGRRFWLFRRDNVVAPAVGDQAWFLHGLF